MDLCVKSVPPNTTKDHLAKHVTQFRRVVSAKVITNIRNGELADYDFVLMGSGEAP